MRFDYECRGCGEVITLKGRIGHPPKAPTHCGKRAQRLYSAPQFSITWGWADYANRAYDGSEQVPGYSHQEVRDTIDSMV